MVASLVSIREEWIKGKKERKRKREMSEIKRKKERERKRETATEKGYVVASLNSIIQCPTNFDKM